MPASTGAESTGITDAVAMPVSTGAESTGITDAVAMPASTNVESTVIANAVAMPASASEESTVSAQAVTNSPVVPAPANPGTDAVAAATATSAGQDAVAVAEPSAPVVSTIPPETLLAPSPTSEVEQAAVVKAIASNPNSSANSNPVNHQVRNGDTLWSIAKRYGLSMAALRRINGLNRDARLKPGQWLKLLP
jgi:membrane-bound lytic murein transglycosylase D